MNNLTKQLISALQLFAGLIGTLVLAVILGIIGTLINEYLGAALFLLIFAIGAVGGIKLYLTAPLSPTTF